MWDGQVYVPVGGRFCPRIIEIGDTDANWLADKAALDATKAAGVSDILISPRRSVVDSSSAAWQKLIDYLDSQGLRYGISFGKGVDLPLRGTVVKPTTYRIFNVPADAEVTWDAAGADSARYVLVDERDGTAIIKEGAARIESGVAIVTTEANLGVGVIGLLYPRKTLPVDNEGSVPDVWTGFDAYRDKLLKTLAAVKFGPGLRFFLDPLADRIGFGGEADSLVPDSPAFKLEWEAFLSRRYTSIEDLMTAWGTTERTVKSYQQAAGMLPLWANAKGVPYLVDGTTGKRNQVGNESRFWSDLRDCRDEGLRYYMRAISDILKREVANVPVLYTHTAQHRIFVNPEKTDGFDGLAISVYGRGSSLVSRGAGSAVSQVEDSARTLWCLVSEVMDAPPASKTSVGYDTKQAMFLDLDWLRGVGARGFYVDSLQALPVEKNAHVQLANHPEQLAWLKEYSERVTRDGTTGTAPAVLLPFPQSAAGIVQPGAVSGRGVWMVPSLAAGRSMVFGSSYLGYTITLPEGESLVIWSLRGPRETHLHADDVRLLRVFSAAGAPIDVKADVKKKTVTLILDETPRIIRTGGQDVFPIEAVEDSLKQLKHLVEQATALKLPALEFKFEMDRADVHYKLKEMTTAHMMAAQALNGIVELMKPYTWIEAEAAETHTFTDALGLEPASGGRILQLSTTAKPPREGYSAQWKFAVPADDSYTVWIAATPPGGQTSPFAWVVDTEQPHNASEGALVGSAYLGDRFVWTRLGRVSIKKGSHNLTLRVLDRTPSADRYNLAIDSILITREAFTPNGILRPALPEPPEKKPGGKK